MENQRNNAIANAANWIIITVTALAVLLYFGNFLKTFAMAVLIWYLIKKLRDTIGLIKVGKIKLPKWLITTLSSVIVFLIIYLIIQIIGSNIRKLTQELPQHSENINIALQYIETQFGIEDLSQNFSKFIEKYQTEMLGYAGSFAGAVGKSLMVIVYVIFLLLEESLFGIKIDKVLKTTQRGTNIQKIGSAITLLFDQYLSVKIFTSFLTGLLSYFALLILGVELAGLWAFLIFLFNFIPTIGSVIATAFPALFALMQNGTMNIFVLVLILVGGIQVLVGSLIEPRIMGEKLNISPLVVILGLGLWGFIWGVIGMLLSVPITATMIIVCSQFENTKPIAILLSKNGDIGLIKKEVEDIEVDENL
ncbi:MULTISPECIES: AI-2E family transporter [Reichenbachiella]|uniref:Predicted PurR-regulated permease PerM n=1 Tax=Reichenbachiella agariperforans TaxID=156994 RepID=A0A1M6M475_REIAG|nr:MULTISPECIES: AI-2E family transporter [Reichenbachiella]MBU2914519.1 AI-2E family transporter [Reichenbachiella agariperforans]RJE73935.1 hypothetical protein BGP76_12040 [Reichenbachiella sp. MSK19-1]SHJ78237.1 Predicted PurR-regulated permease PerM [Reichenbachiella agariperforans]